MRSDVFSADDAVLFFEKCLREEGLKDVDVAHATNEFTDVFYIRKKLGTEQLAYKVALDPAQNEGDTRDETLELMRKRIAQESKHIAEEFKDTLVDVFEWGGRSIEVSMHNGGWAECRSCNTRVKFNRRPSTLFSADAELSTPQPRPRDTKRAVAELSGHREYLLKLYLIGQLREQCDRNCPNNKYNRNNPPAVLRSTTEVNAD